MFEPAEPSRKNFDNQSINIPLMRVMSKRRHVSRVETGPDYTTDDSFDAMSIICRREAPPGTGRVQQFGENDGSVYSLQCLVVHAVTVQHVDDVQ